MGDVFRLMEELLEEHLSLCVDFEEEMTAREMILNAFDPIVPNGEPFTFEKREPSEFYISLAVPGSWDYVDLFRAFEVALLDAKASKLTLQHDHSLAATLRVYKNTLQWLRFWSVRYPSAEGREKFEGELEVRWKGLEALRLKAKLTFNFAVTEELASI